MSMIATMKMPVITTMAPRRFPIPRSPPRAPRVMTLSRRRGERGNDLQDGWTENDDEQRREDHRHQWERHLHRRERDPLFRVRPALAAEGDGRHSQHLGDARSPLFGLNETRRERTKIVDSGAAPQPANRFLARHAGVGLSIDDEQLA